VTAEHHAAWEYRVEVAERLGKTHECCVVDCTQVTLVGFLACRKHWMMLRGQTRSVLVEAFRRRHSDPEIYAEAVALARRLLNERAAA
jgi:hypothetical protein